MKILIIPSKFYDIDIIFDALNHDVHPIVYDYYSDMPTIHHKIMRSLHSLCNRNSNIDVGIVLASDSVGKARLFDGDKAPLTTDNIATWGNVGMLLSSVHALLSCNHMFVLHPTLDDFKFAGLQRRFYEYHAIKLINAFDFTSLTAHDPYTMFFTDSINNHPCLRYIFPTTKLCEKLAIELGKKLTSVIGTNIVSFDTMASPIFPNIWKKLKDVLVLNDLNNEEAIITDHFDNPSRDTFHHAIRSLLRILFATNRDALETLVGDSGLTFVACIELLMLQALTMDINVFAIGFYGYIFGKDDRIKASLLQHIESNDFLNKIETVN